MEIHPPVREHPPVNLTELMQLLGEAALEMAERKGRINVYSNYKSYADFAEHLLEQVKRLGEKDFSALNEIKLIFLPTGDWDDADGSPDMANRISALLAKCRF
jgi:hypothetical protein